MVKRPNPENPLIPQILILTTPRAETNPNAEPPILQILIQTTPSHRARPQPKVASPIPAAL